jgi:hypothetical protein
VATSINSTLGIRTSAADSMRAQAFKATFTKTPTAITKLARVGTVVPNQYKFWAEIWNTTGGTSGTPTSIFDVAAKSQEYDVALLSTTSTPFIFNFPSSLTYTIGTEYAIVIRSDLPLSGSNYITVDANSSGGYADGLSWKYDSGSLTWVEQTGWDLYLVVYNHFLTDFGNSHKGWGDLRGSETDGMWNSEPSIAIKDNDNAILMWRQHQSFLAVPTHHPHTGMLYARNISIPHDGSSPVLGDIRDVGYHNFDPNLVLNFSLGNPTTYDKSLTTGANTGYPIYSRSHIVAYDTTAGISATPTFPLDDLDFPNGCILIGTGSSGAYYGASAGGNYDGVFKLANYPFIFEAEIKPITTTGGDNRFILKHGSAFNVRLDSTTGKLVMQDSTSGAQVITLDAEPLSYHKIRILKGTDGIFHIYRATVAPYTSFTETGYTSNNINGNTFATSVTNFSIGYNHVDGLGGFNGKIGYIKMAIGVSSFVYDGYYDQAPIVNPTNLGRNLFTGKKIIGQELSFTFNNNFGSGVVGNGQESALVDSYTQRILTNKALTPGRNCNVKIGMNRVSESDQSHIKGIIYSFGK